MRSFGDLVHALSWRIAADTASCVSQSALVEVHPGGFGADILSLQQRNGQQAIAINRLGTLQTAGGELTWADVLRLGTLETTGRLLTSAGFAAKRRPTSPQRRTYRVIAEVLAARLPDAAQWEVRSALFDALGPGSGVQPALLLGQQPLALADPRQVWTLLRDGVPVLAFNDGEAFYPDGYRLTLMELPSDAEHHIAAYLLRRVPGA